MLQFLAELRFRNELLFFFGLICFVLGAVCLLLVKLNPIQVLGTSAWFKPFKFFISTAIFVWSMGWYAHHLPNERAVYVYSVALVVLFTVEDLYILIQAARGTRSHFNVDSAFTQVMWPVMGICAVAISVWTAIVGIGFFTNDFPDLSPAYVWSIRMGLIIFVLFSLEGLAMGARMAHTVGAADGGEGVALVNWSKANGDLRVAHFFGMHALQVLPLVATFIVRDFRVMIVISLLYAAGVVYTFVQAIGGQPFHLVSSGKKRSIETQFRQEQLRE